VRLPLGCQGATQIVDGELLRPFSRSQSRKLLLVG